MFRKAEVSSEIGKHSSENGTIAVVLSCSVRIISHLGKKMRKTEEICRLNCQKPGEFFVTYSKVLEECLGWHKNCYIEKLTGAAVLRLSEKGVYCK